ncbi:uncharacterized protein LOC132601376 [Lycium barbarum]|uniref:uncharacterized protein LOC132601376 n=1 Tax=Lycium barbarum TaxID=112863 RepID=UPI00293ECB38|nr:uncharacterized protein LOC132601376 [Lycium barbarum]
MESAGDDGSHQYPNCSKPLSSSINFNERLNWQADCPSGELVIVSGKFVEGKLRWATKTPGFDMCKGGSIISFDLAGQKWEKVEHPVYREGYIKLWSGVLGNHLSLFCEYKGMQIDIWAMNEYGVKEFWEMMFTFNYPDMEYHNCFYPPFFMSNKGEFLIVIGPISMIYNWKNGSHRFSKVVGISGDSQEVD